MFAPCCQFCCYTARAAVVLAAIDRKLLFSFLIVKVGSLNEYPTRMGNRKNKPQGWEIEKDQSTRMGEGCLRETPSLVSQVPTALSTPSVHSAYDGYAAFETVGSLERFLKGLFLKSVLYTSSTSTSTGALRRMPRHTGKFQVSQVKVFSFLDSDELKDRPRAGRF